MIHRGAGYLEKGPGEAGGEGKTPQMARVDSEFRAAVLGSTAPRNAARQAVSAGEPRPFIFHDTRSLTRGVKSSMRWSQTRPGQDESGRGLGGDHLDLSGQGKSGSRTAGDPRLADAHETLTDVLAELSRRGLGEHPRARALAHLRDTLSGPGSSGRPAPTSAPGSWQSVRDEAADLWEAVLATIRSPAGRVAHKKELLARAQQAGGRGDLAGERRLLRRVLVGDPSDATAHARLGRLHLDAGQLAEAEPHLGAAAAARPKEPAAHIALGELHYRRQDPEAAIASFGRALRLNPDHSDANAWLGILAYDAQRPVEAQRFLERAIALDSNNSVARYYLAQLSLANGDTLRADFQLSVFRRLEPTAQLDPLSSAADSLASGRPGKGYSGWQMPRRAAAH